MDSENLRSCHDNNISVVLMMKFGLQRGTKFVFSVAFGPSYKMLIMKEKHEKGLSFGWTRELLCPSPAGAVLLSRVFRAKPVSMFLGIKVLFFFPAEAGASCDAQVLFLALNLDFHFLVSVPLFIMCTCGQLQTTQKYPEESLPQGRRLSITKHVGIVPSYSSPVTEM